MHSTFRADLRNTQRAIELLRTRQAKRLRNTSRPFSYRSHLRSEPKPNARFPFSNSIAEFTGSVANVTPVGFKPAQLRSEIENWINHLNKHGKSLRVWDTISKKDEQGTWKLLPHVEQDIKEVEQWLTRNSIPANLPFAIKIADGRIRALTTKELHEEQDVATTEAIVHGPFVSTADTAEKTLNTASAEVDEFGIGSPRIESQSSVSATYESHLPTSSVEDTRVPSSEPMKFHGSAAARRQRAHRAKDRVATFMLPQWFTSHNVVVRKSQRPNASRGAKVRPVRSFDFVASKFALVVPSSASDIAEPAIASGSNEVNNTAVNATKEDEGQAIAEGGDGGSPPSSTGNSGTPSRGRGRSPILIPLPDSDNRYHVEEAQHNELMTTAKGRLMSPVSGATDTRPGGIRSHLIVHYAAKNGDYLLDHLVEDMAQRLECNLISLDAQDISDLIAMADVENTIKHEAAMLGYEVYNEIYKDGDNSQDSIPPYPSEDFEEGEDDAISSAPQGVPFMVGKPITIDLKALFSSKPHRRSSSARPSSILSELVGPNNSSKFTTPLFASIIDSILSSTGKEHSKHSQDNPEHSVQTGQPPSSEATLPSKDSSIIHIKELRVIQDTSVGKQFLLQLYDQVERRRAQGETIMLVGTECSREDGSSYDHNKIEDLQSSVQDEISSTLVITPIGSDKELDLSSDRSKKLQTINARHLWQMLQSKELSVKSLEPGFWTKDFVKMLHAADLSYLEKGLWSFSYVQRLSAILASSEFTESQHPIAEAAAVIDLSDKSKISWANQVKKEAKESSKNSKQSGKDRIAKIREKANKHEKRLLNGVVEPSKIRTTFKDIHIPVETVDALKTLTTLSLVRPDAFSYGVLASDRIPGLLLYGPPGTGKTLAAKAVARESGATMLEVSAADINDMYVGEGEKNVKALFSLAKKLSPCVVFLDEADAMFSARSTQGRRASHRELLNQFLKEWDGMSNDSGSAFIMVATNRPMDLDDAVLRRLPRRVLVDLPTENDRLEILKIHLRNEQLADDVNLSQLATKTPFYSGSDLKNVAVSAALNAVQEENEHAKQHTGEQSYQYPDRRTLTARHFEKALDEISASISEDMASLRDIKKFDEQYGDKRGRKKKSPKWGFKTTAEADAVLDTIKVRT